MIFPVPVDFAMKLVFGPVPTSSGSGSIGSVHFSVFGGSNSIFRVFFGLILVCLFDCSLALKIPDVSVIVFRFYNEWLRAESHI